jgi:hypothetical protein
MFADGLDHARQITATELSETRQRVEKGIRFDATLFDHLAAVRQFEGGIVFDDFLRMFIPPVPALLAPSPVGLTRRQLTYEIVTVVLHGIEPAGQREPPAGVALAFRTNGDFRAVDAWGAFKYVPDGLRGDCIAFLVRPTPANSLSERSFPLACATLDGTRRQSVPAELRPAANLV